MVKLTIEGNILPINHSRQSSLRVSPTDASNHDSFVSLDQSMHTSTPKKNNLQDSFIDIETIDQSNGKCKDNNQIIRESNES